MRQETVSFEHGCAYCGARLRVNVPHGPFADHKEEYPCPECGKRYDIDAARRPRVELLERRRDGKEDRYQDTMF
jgi:DNA-directed RNA polymerase subunit RPC12/RpoP